MIKTLYKVPFNLQKSFLIHTCSLLLCLMLFDTIYATTEYSADISHQEQTCIDADWSEIQQTQDDAQHRSITKNLSSDVSGVKKKEPVEIAKMGFLSGILDFLAARFGGWFAEEERGEKEKLIVEKAVEVRSMMDCPAGTAPTVTAFALSASCTNSIPNDDAYLQISAATDATHYDFTPGSTYTGNGFVDGIAFDPTTDLPLQFGTLANPAAATDYTIRVFNGLDACFTDVVVTLEPQTDCAGGCECEEYVYLNEGNNGGIVHKFEINESFDVNVDPATAAIAQEIGSPWYDNGAVGETLINPHGLGHDLNGFLYIGENARADQGANVRKLTCDGTIIPAIEFSIPDAGFNLASNKNILYVGTHDFDASTPNTINAYDLCTGDPLGFYCLTGIAESKDWGLYLDDNGMMYLTSNTFRDDQGGDVPNQLYKFDINTNSLNAPGEANPVCIEPFISEGVGEPTLGDNTLPVAQIFGVTTDSDDNIFIVERTGPTDANGTPTIAAGSARILKYDSNGNFVTSTPWDSLENGLGYIEAIGIYYSETLDLIFVSTASPIDDCVVLFDTDLNNIGGVIPSPGDGSQSKGINIAKECCPTNNRQTIDQTYCISDTSALTFLNEVYECEGITCEGIWEVVSIDPTVTYDDCSQTVTMTGAGGCATFVKSSDGVGNNLQCGAFEVTLNVCFIVEDTPEISVTDNDCNAATPGIFTVSTPCEAGSTIEWSTDNGTTWSTSAPTYDNLNVMTVIARCVNGVDNTCISEESAVVTSNPTDCCAAPPCFGIDIQQN